MGLSSSHDSTSVSARFTRTPEKRDGYFVHPHAYMIAVWNNYQVNSCHWKAFFSYYSDSQICNVRDLGNVHPDAFGFPCRKTEAQGTQWEEHNHRTQSENSGFLRSRQSSALSTIARGHHLSHWLRSRSTAGRASHRNHEIAAALNWWHSVIEWQMYSSYLKLHLHTHTHHHHNQQPQQQHYNSNKRWQMSKISDRVGKHSCFDCMQHKVPIVKKPPKIYQYLNNQYLNIPVFK